MRTLTLGLILLCFLSCGKKVDEGAAETTPRTVTPQESDVELELAKQELTCGTERSCPSNLLKVVVAHRGNLTFCTGFLVDQKLIATAASCLPDRLRFKDMPCDQDVFFFFPNANLKPKRLGCTKVMDVSALTAKEPHLWRSNVAYLGLSEAVEAKTFTVARTGMTDRERLVMWTVDQVDSVQGIIRKSDECLSVSKSYFNPLSTTNISPVMTIAGCDYRNGNSGSPVVDFRGRVRGMVSRPVDQADLDEVVAMRILQKPLKALYFATNFSCAPIFGGEDIPNDAECHKKLEISDFDLAQRAMLSETALFKAPIERFEKFLNDSNQFLNLASKLDVTGDGYDVGVEPKCFKNSSRWMGEYGSYKFYTFSIDVPGLNIKRSMNEYGLISTLQVMRPAKRTNFQFKPSTLRATQRSVVFVWSDGPTTTIQNVPQSCALLF